MYNQPYPMMAHRSAYMADTTHVYQTGMATENQPKMGNASIAFWDIKGAEALDKSPDMPCMKPVRGQL